METRIVEIAERIRGLREMLGISCEDMAKFTGVTVEDYVPFENARNDFNFTFLYKLLFSQKMIK